MKDSVLGGMKDLVLSWGNEGFRGNEGFGIELG